MRVTRLEDLAIWIRSRGYVKALFAITQLPRFSQDRRLREQLNDCADSILSNIAEGFGQSTDVAFARYLTISRGSILESRCHLLVALDRNYATADRVEPQLQEACEIEKMMLALIRYLHRSNRKNRI